MAHACPVCGGNVEPKIGEVFAHCPYCSAAVAVENSAVVERYMVPSRLTPDAAQRALRRWMHGSDPVAGLATHCSFSPLPAGPTWLPVWYIRGSQNRTTKGKRTVATGGATEYLADYKSVPEIDIEQQLIAPGALERVRDDAAGPQLPPPQLSLQSVLGHELGPNESKEIALVHVPFYHLTYQYRNQAYSAAVDAVTGRVSVRDYPQKNEIVFFIVTIVFFLIYWALNWWSRGFTSDDDVGMAMFAYLVTFIVSVVSALITMAVV